MGPPGAGKGTQGDRLAARFDVPRLATGDMLREAREVGSELGRQARRYMDAGELVPDDVILGLIDEAVRALSDGGFVLDGFPRTVAQARELQALLSRREEPLDAVVELVVPEEELVRRLSGRRLCQACGEVTHVSAVGERSPCPACGGELIQRTDDRPETVRRRLQVYRDQTEAVQKWYRASDVPVHAVDGTGSVTEVSDRLLAVLPSEVPISTESETGEATGSRP